MRRTLVDWLFEELLEYLDQQIEQIKNDCSVLFVCLMSHGDTGVIFDREGRKGEINKVLAKFHILNQILPVVGGSYHFSAKIDQKYQKQCLRGKKGKSIFHVCQ